MQKKIGLLLVKTLAMTRRTDDEPPQIMANNIMKEKIKTRRADIHGNPGKEIA